MNQGILTISRMYLLMSKELACPRPRRTGERKHKSAHRGSVDTNRSSLNLVTLEGGGETRY